MSENNGSEPPKIMAAPVMGEGTITHYLCSVMTDGEPVDAQEFATGMAQALSGMGVMPVMSTAYISRFGINPTQSGVKDIWLGYCGNGMLRSTFAQHHPELTKALDLLVGITASQIAPDPTLENEGEKKIDDKENQE